MTYGCHNKPRPVAGGFYIAQDGWLNIGKMHEVPVHRTPILVAIGIVTTTDCQYTLGTLDAACNGCQWQHGGAIERTGPGGRIPAARVEGSPRPERTPERADVPADPPTAPRPPPT